MTTVRDESSLDGVAVPAGAGWTALVGAASRAGESVRPDALFRDPWAPLFVAAAPHQQDGREPRFRPGGDGTSNNEMWHLLDGFFVGRTPFIDAEVLRARESGVDQFVLLGAGLDARAERLGFTAGEVVFEVDSGDVLAYKSDVLARHGVTSSRRVPVEADLSGEWLARLVAAGFDSERLTCWVIEGLLLYLDDAAGRALLSEVGQAGPVGSRVVLDHISQRLSVEDFSLDDPRDREVCASGLRLMTSELGEDPGTWAAARGLRPTRVSDIAAELGARGRPIPVKLDRLRPRHIIGWLISGTTSLA